MNSKTFVQMIEDCLNVLLNDSWEVIEEGQYPLYVSNDTVVTEGEEN